MSSSENKTPKNDGGSLLGNSTFAADSEIVSNAPFSSSRVPEYQKQSLRNLYRKSHPEFALSGTSAFIRSYFYGKSLFYVVSQKDVNDFSVSYDDLNAICLHAYSVQAYYDVEYSVVFLAFQERPAGRDVYSSYITRITTVTLQNRLKDILEKDPKRPILVDFYHSPELVDFGVINLDGDLRPDPFVRVKEDGGAGIKDYLDRGLVHRVENVVEAFAKSNDIIDESTVQILRDLGMRILSDVPEFNALQELRAQFASDISSPSGRSKMRIEGKAKYPGRRSSVDPLDFLIREYANEIASGTLTPGPVQVFDQNLTSSLAKRLGEDDFRRKHFVDGDAPGDLHELFARLAKSRFVEGGTKAKRRVTAAAALLNTEDAEAASRFFTRLRPGRLTQK